MWKSWINRNGGLTTRIREHMNKHHGKEFQTKCRQESFCSPGKSTNNIDDDLLGLEFTPELFMELLAK